VRFEERPAAAAGDRVGDVAVLGAGAVPGVPELSRQVHGGEPAEAAGACVAFAVRLEAAVELVEDREALGDELVTLVGLELDPGRVEGRVDEPLDVGDVCEGDDCAELRHEDPSIGINCARPELFAQLPLWPTGPALKG
jgi:hypothetical protein